MKQKQQTVVIETPEHFELQFKLAGIGSRFLAYLVDKLIQLSLLLVLAFSLFLALLAAGGLFPRDNWWAEISGVLGRWVIAGAIIGYGVVVTGYFMLFEYMWNGTTPGKRSQSIRVMRKDGRPITFIDSAIRNILRNVDILAEVYPIGLVVMFVDSRNRRLGDLAAGTLVVLDREIGALSLGEAVAHPLVDDPEIRFVASRVTPDDYRIVTRFLARREEFDREHREELAHGLYSRIVEKSGRAGARTAEPEKALEVVSALYRERTRIL